jgi:acetolactate synthase-1/2/3 large subunit
MVKKVRLSGAEAVARTMKACGVDYFFYVPGGMHEIFSQIENSGVNMVLCRNEKAACNMADGYSRVTKKPSVCYAQNGAAAAILGSMMYEPMYAHSPVIALTGSTPTKEKAQFTYQECYEMPYFESTCKFSADVTDVSKLAEYIRSAIQISVSGCPGPTHISMHHDMDETVADMPEIYGNKQFFSIPPFRPRAEPERIAEAATLLSDAQNPVIVCGSGVHLSGAYEEVRALAELLGIPVATNCRGKGCFPEEHPLYVGVTGSYGSELANEIVREADVVFFIATRAGRHETDGLTAPERGASKIIHLDIDPVVIGRNYKTEVALVGDAKLTLQDLLSAFKTKVTKYASKPRLQVIAKAIEKYESIIKPMMDSDAIPIKPQRIMKEVSKILKASDIVVSDTGHMLCWTSKLLKQKAIGLSYIPCGGTLGSSFAMAIGASFGAMKDQRVLNLIGDGGLAYNLSELETAKRYNAKHVPFVALVNNNSSFAQPRPSFIALPEKYVTHVSYCDLTELDYAKIAESFGCYGVRVERPAEISEALKNAFESGKPALVDVVSDKTEYPPWGWLRVKLKKKEYPAIPVY